MDLGEKLELLASSARYDASCASSGSDRAAPRGGLGATMAAGVCHSWTSDGRCISLLKVLLSNSCRNDCAYCVNRISSDVRRTSFSPDELARLTIGFYRRNYVEGLFLSSGIFADPDIVMDRMTEVARLLREREGFGGYIHLKAIPGCGEKALRRAGLFADRLSANIELPTASSLALLAPQKTGVEIIGAMRFMSAAESESKADRRRYRSTPRFAPAGQSTQIIVGASPESDLTILRLAGSLYKKIGLRRVYYSAFVPVAADPRLPATSSPPLLREHRLYQADWLVRCYGFGVNEILDEAAPSLLPDLDPKTSWALRHPERFPVDALVADYDTLLRVPGIGVVGARRIVATRRSGAIRNEDLGKMGIVMKRARWFLSLGGRPIEDLPGGAYEQSTLRAILADRRDLAAAATPALHASPAPGAGPALGASPALGAGPALGEAGHPAQLEFSFA